jgi:hypothetical protein
VSSPRDQKSAPVEVSWFWDWVPAAGRDAAELSAWTESIASLLDGWAGEKVAAARAAWPADSDEEFPFTVGEMGSAVARGLLERADELPGHCRLIWGAAFFGEDVRWLPLIVGAEFRQARPEDPAYLMAVVGAEGFEDDIREPNVDYVSTDHGDGIRVLALARTEAEGVHARVDAALRLEAPAVPDVPAVPDAPEVLGTPSGDIDVLLSTRVSGLDQIAVIGSGVEALMNMIATQFAAQPGDAAPQLRFATRAEQDFS